MEFLPILIDGKRTYAGFWIRSGAAIVDAALIAPLALGIFYVQTFNFALAVILAVVSSILFAMYNVYFNAVYGGTLGKLIAGIRVTMPNGGKIGWREAWYRSSIDLVFAGLFLILELTSLYRLDWEMYQSQNFNDRLDMLVDQYPAWHQTVDYANGIWVWGELIVLLLNQRKRAIHDYIAGTVVIHKEFAEQGASIDVSVAPQPSNN